MGQVLIAGKGATGIFRVVWNGRDNGEKGGGDGAGSRQKVAKLRFREAFENGHGDQQIDSLVELDAVDIVLPDKGLCYGIGLGERPRAVVNSPCFNLPLAEGANQEAFGATDVEHGAGIGEELGEVGGRLFEDATK